MVLILKFDAFLHKKKKERERNKTLKIYFFKMLQINLDIIINLILI